MISEEDTFPGEIEMVEAAKNAQPGPPISKAEEAEILASLPPAGSPMRVVRPVRLPYDLDETVQELAAARGVSVSAFIRECVADAVAGAVRGNDPQVELRRLLSRALRAVESLPRGGAAA